MQAAPIPNAIAGAVADFPQPGFCRVRTHAAINTDGACLNAMLFNPVFSFQRFIVHVEIYLQKLKNMI